MANSGSADLPVQLTTLGAAGTVTGSCTLLECGGRSLLVKPLFTAEDGSRHLDLIRTEAFEEAFEPVDGVEARLWNAGLARSALVQSPN